jgi:phage terminase large subunit-like protein
LVNLAALEQRRRVSALFRYQPYQKQKEFHKAGGSFRERLLMAGNQCGKTYSAAKEVAYHALGEYPDWWEGRVFEKPILAWTGSVTNETSKKIIQKALLGTEDPNPKGPDFGTGSIPKDRLVKVSTRQAGIKGVVDEIIVRHKSGRHSAIALQTYEMGRQKWQGAQVDVVWFDEEPPGDLYSEGLTRTQATGGIVLTTFTPLLGYSEMVLRFTEPEEGAKRHITNMTIYDAEHYTEEEREAIMAGWLPHERKTRAMGIPMAGEGMVFPIDEDEIRVDPFELPAHFSRICGVDFGLDHPFAAVWIAYDEASDTMFVYDCFKKSNETPVYHAAAINKRDPNGYIPVVWPHDGMNRDKQTKRALWKAYREAGVKMYRLSARYEDATGGAQAIKPACMDILERMKTGRFKVFSTCSDWFAEMRTFHFKDGKVVDVNDDIMAATRYAAMMIRKAKVFQAIVVRRAKYNRPIVGAA